MACRVRRFRCIFRYNAPLAAFAGFCLYRHSVFATPLPSLTPLVGMGEQLSPAPGRGPSALSLISCIFQHNALLERAVPHCSQAAVSVGEHRWKCPPPANAALLLRAVWCRTIFWFWPYGAFAPMPNCIFRHNASGPGPCWSATPCGTPLVHATL